MKYKQRRNRLIALFALCLAGLLGWRTWPRERLLLNLAKPVMSTAEFRPRTGLYDYQLPYYWLSDHEVGYFVNDAADAHRTFTVRDTVTGQTQRHFTASIDQLPFGEDGKLSPDNRWLLWIHRSRSRNTVPTVYALDGSRVITFPASWDNDLTWMPDSRRLATIYWGIEQRDLATRTIRSLTLPGAPQSELLGFTPQSHAIAVAGLASFFRPFPGGGTLVPSPSNYPIMHLTEYALEPSPRPVRTYTVHVPGDAAYGFVSLSPLGDRLLWGLHCEMALPLQEWLQRLIPSYKPPLHPIIRWQVSRLDGSDMHEIGHAMPKQFDSAYSSPKWLPDGKHISFIRSNTLYIVPIDH